MRSVASTASSKLPSKGASAKHRRQLNPCVSLILPFPEQNSDHLPRAVNTAPRLLGFVTSVIATDEGCGVQTTWDINHPQCGPTDALEQHSTTGHDLGQSGPDPLRNITVTGSFALKDPRQVEAGDLHGGVAAFRAAFEE